MSVPNFGLHPWWIQRHFAAGQLEEEGDASSLEELQPLDSDSGIGDDAVTGLDRDVGLRGWEQQLEALLMKYPLAGVGECGLDKGMRRMDGWIDGRQMDASYYIWMKEMTYY